MQERKRKNGVVNKCRKLSFFLLCAQVHAREQGSKRRERGGVVKERRDKIYSSSLSRGTHTHEGRNRGKKKEKKKGRRIGEREGGSREEEEVSSSPLRAHAPPGERRRE